MRAGKLRHKILIEDFTETQNEFGEPSKSWETYASVWASKQDITGSEGFGAQQILAEVTTRFEIRWLEGVTADMRINHNGTLYDLQAAQDPDGKRRKLVLLATKAGA